MSAQLARAIRVAALLAGASSCSPGGGQWHKPGADEQTITRDSSECRAAAQEEAERRYPFRASSPTLGADGTGLSQQRDDHARAVAERRSSTAACRAGATCANPTTRRPAATRAMRSDSGRKTLARER